MGATGWSYFVPYQADINQALQHLKQDVFNQGAYEQPDVGSVEEFSRLIPKPLLPWRDLLLAEFRYRQRTRRRKPKTIKQLLKQVAEDGTHSILDIERIAAERALGTIVPLLREELIQIFGTDMPTHEIVERASLAGHLEKLYGRWEGIYVIVYKQSEPDEIYFEGASGD